MSLRTNNRNYEGRSGTKDAQVYLVSPEVAVAAALTGKVGTQAACGIYEWRPSPCREFAAGSQACDRARMRQGLPPFPAQAHWA